MIFATLSALVLVAITVAVHAVGFTVATRSFRSQALPTRFWPVVWLVIRVTWSLVVIHLIEISVWGMFFYWQDCLPDLESAFYFAGVTYTSIGYGDLVLPKPWRMLAPIEGLTGILMCALSAGIFVALLGRLREAAFSTEKE